MGRIAVQPPVPQHQRAHARRLKQLQGWSRTNSCTIRGLKAATSSDWSRIGVGER